MPKAKCTTCKGTGLVVSRAGNRWCDCPLGREYITEINKARKQMGHGPLPAKPGPSGPAVH